MAKRRPYTSAEIYEIEKLAARGFEGRGTLDEMDRCIELRKINSEEYGAIGKRVRAAISDRIKRHGA